MTMSGNGQHNEAPRPRRAVWPWVLLNLAVLLAGAALLVLFPPAALVTPIVAGKIKAATGLDLTASGAHYSLLPRITARLQDATLSGGDGGDPVLQAKSLEAVLPLSAAWGGNSDVLSLSLTKPVVSLSRDGKGNRERVGAAPSAAPSAAPHAEAAAAPLVVRNLTVTDGTLRYHDAGAGKNWEIGAISARTAMDPATGAIEANGTATLHGEPLTFTVASAQAQKLIAGEAAPMTAKLGGKPATATFTGQAALREPSFEGDVKIAAANAPELAKWLGLEPGASIEPGAMSLAAHASWRGSTLSLANLEVDLGTSHSSGTLELGFTGPRPKAVGSLTWKSLDLSALLSPATPPKPKAASLAPEAAEDGLTVRSAYMSLEAALSGEGVDKAAAPLSAAAASTAASDWSDTSFDLAILQSFDADLALKAERVKAGGLSLANADATVNLGAGKLAVDVKNVDIGKGHTKATIGLDTNVGEPSGQVDLTLRGVAAEQVLSAISNQPALSGPTDIAAKLNAKGRNMRALVTSLEGEARFAVGKGALEGFDLKRIIGEWWKSWTYDKRYRTPFQRLEGQYIITRGVAHNDKDAAFDGDGVDITAKGRISAPARTLDQKVKLMLGGIASGLSIPLTVAGRWEKPRVDWDIGTLFAAPQSYASPMSVATDKAAAAAAMPKSVREAIEKALAKSPAESKLSEPARALLREMIGG